MSMASQANEPEVREVISNLAPFMNKRLISRRHLLITGLVGCSAMMTGLALPSSEEPPSGYSYL
jgi:hypothetical protein